ncbi:probable iron/ascorbate oxidoreductase DDB_G0283291 isoform X2 [Macrobrachium rosenbergii]|uniref:probable iron/ascorbate oxidoreductase DDB_G0283291 isoform X2 n=1 Tax=Macrobrachium rosenbergii TaxID=79674 RepID=UPI0034D5A10A
MSEDQIINQMPVVDIGLLGVDNKSEPTDEELLRVGKEISDAFQENGFVYLNGLGSLEEQVSRIEKAGSTFFDFQRGDKEKYHLDLDKKEGYMAINEQRLDYDFSHELHESFDIMKEDGIFPDDLVPDLRPAAKNLLDSLKMLTGRILTAIALGLELDRNVITDLHKNVSGDGGLTALRLLHYPPVPQHLLKISTRFGAHTDWGTITFIFQDEVGGLQVRLNNGDWASAVPIPGTVLLLVGEMFDIQTSHKFRALEHRVVIPEEDSLKGKSRRSTTFFVMPDKHVQVKPLWGSPATEPLSVEEFLSRKLKGTLKY